MKKSFIVISMLLALCSCGTSRKAAETYDLGEEVYDTGYTKTLQKNSASSVGKVKFKQNSGYSNIYDYLVGMAAGLQVNGTEITIRGSNSTSDGTPLIVVDGQVVNDISTINPNDVAEVQVLKDAADIALYGSRGANGVLVINLRHGGEDN